uniref:Uncharacterized protein n=1 Tax=Macrostomum lignano TaxID=282301 RepID=A0A1I8F3P9_9PLAT
MRIEMRGKASLLLLLTLALLSAEAAGRPSRMSAGGARGSPGGGWGDLASPGWQRQTAAAGVGGGQGGAGPPVSKNAEVVASEVLGDSG